MKATLKLRNPDELEATLTFTATLAVWKELKALIDKCESPNRYPLGTLNRAILDTVRAAEAHFESDERDVAV